MEALKRDRDDVADLCYTPTLGRGATERINRRDHPRVEMSAIRSRMFSHLSLAVLDLAHSLLGTRSVGTR
jgi:hypothetical protein